jgi:hypothetical protein
MYLVSFLSQFLSVEVFYWFFDHSNWFFAHSTLRIRYIFFNFFLSWISPDEIRRMTLFELHFVLRQCPSFITKQKFNLAKFLDQVWIAAWSKIHIFSEKHSDIIVDHFLLSKLKHLYKDIKRDRDHMGVCYPKGEKLDNIAHSDVVLDLDRQVH